MNRLATTGWRWLIAGLALAILTAACGSNSAPAPGAAGAHPASLNVELDWVPNPDHVGFYYAQHQGYFARQHLTVNFRVPSSAADPLKLVGLGKADLAISYEPELFYAQQAHLPVTAVATVIPVPLNGLIVSPKLRITSLCQIKGHSVGFTGVPSDYAFYSTLLHTCHLTRQQVPYQTVGYNLVPSILSGKVNSIIGGYRNVEAIQISQEMKQQGHRFPREPAGGPPLRRAGTGRQHQQAALGSRLCERRPAVRGRVPRRHRRRDEEPGGGDHRHAGREPVQPGVPAGERPLHAEAARPARWPADRVPRPGCLAGLRELAEGAQTGA